MRYILLRENLQQARKILKNLGIEDTNPEFIEIKKLLGNNLGYLGMFTKLFYKFRYPLDELVRLKAIIDSNKQLLKDLPKQVIEYTNIEELEDNINVVKEWVIYRREFVRKLPSILRNTARNDEEIKNIFVQLTDKQKEYIYKTFMRIISDYRNYDQFKRDLYNVVESSDQELSELLQRIEDEEHAYLIYNKDNIVVAEIYNHETSCKLGTKSWCISREGGEGYWDDYNNMNMGRKQYFIWNFNAPSTHLDRMLAVTISSNGRIHHSQLMGVTPSINVPEYLKKYNIPSNIIVPLDLEKDLHKILKVGVTREIITTIKEDGVDITKEDMDMIINHIGFNYATISLLKARKLIDYYVDDIPLEIRALYGLVNEDELPQLDYIKKLIHSEDLGGEREELTDFCNNIDEYEFDIDNYLRDNRDLKSVHIINSMNLRDKLVFIDEYSELFTREGVSVFLYEDLGNSLVSIDMDISDNNGYIDIDFIFRVDVSEFSKDILGFDDYVYNALTTTMTHPMEFLDEERLQNSIKGYLSGSGEEVLISFLNFIKKQIPHPNYHAIINNYIDDNTVENDNEIIELINKVFPSITSQYDAPFDEFWHELILSASEKVEEDTELLNDHIKGEFSYHTDGGWRISLEDLLELFNIYISEESDYTSFYINDWLSSTPLDVHELKFNFGYEDPSPWVYLQDVDASNANRVFVEEVTELLEEFEDNSSTWLSDSRTEILEYLPKQYEPIYINEGSAWTPKHWFGYQRVPTRGKKAPMVIIPLDEIDTTQVVTYFLRNNIDEYSNKNGGKLEYSDLTLGNKEYLTQIGIKIRKVGIDEIMKGSAIDPNQYEIQFERIKSFNSYWKLK